MALVVEGDAGYEQARRVWSRAVDRKPAAIAQCATEQDVVDAVRHARDNELPLSVRGGGHDWAGRAIRDGGLVVDLSRMRGVTIADGANGADGVVELQGGVRAGDAVAAALPHGYAPVVGTVSEVGVTGLTLGGGYGGLIGKHGLALDNLLGARVVLADGSVVDTDAEQNPDLYWALRGGGGNFGVVTSMRMRVHPLRTVVAGMVAFPLDQAATVLRDYQHFARQDELSIIASFFTGPDGPLLGLMPVWSGDHEVGEYVLADLPSLGKPAFVQMGLMTLPSVLGLMDANITGDRSACADSRWLPTITDEAAQVLVEAAHAFTSPYSAIALHHFHGAACRVPADATAWSLRTEHRQVEIIAGWPEDDPADKHLEWVSRLSSALSPHALPGGYPNLLGPGEQTRVRLAHGANLGRLREVKEKFDPDGVFTAVAAADVRDNGGGIVTSTDVRHPANPAVIHQKTGCGQSVWFGDAIYTFKATRETTNGMLTLAEASVPPGGGPPPHIHESLDEAFIVLGGEIEFLNGDTTFVAHEGDFVFIPRGTRHRFRNVGIHQARLIFMFVPGGMEHFFMEIGMDAKAGVAPQPMTPEQQKMIPELAPYHGLRLAIEG